MLARYGGLCVAKALLDVLRTKQRGGASEWGALTTQFEQLIAEEACETERLYDLIDAYVVLSILSHLPLENTTAH